jgi:hypothetical protein
MLPPDNLTDVTAVAWSSDDTTQCWRHSGAASNKLIATPCNAAAGGTTKYDVVCEVPMNEYRTIDRWTSVMMPNNNDPYMAILFVPYRNTYANSNASCKQYGGELAYLPNLTYARSYYWPVAKQIKWGISTTETSTDYYCPDVTGSSSDGAFVGNTDAYANSPYKNFFGSNFHVAASTAQRYKVDFATSTGNANGASIGASVSNPSLCTRMLDQLTVQLLDTTCDANATARVKLTLAWTPPREISFYITTSNHVNARPRDSNKVTFAAGAELTALSQTVYLLCITGGTSVTVNVTNDAETARWLMGRSPSWSGTNSLSITTPSFTNRNQVSWYKQGKR